MNTELKERATSLAELKDLKGMYGLSENDLIMEIYKHRLPIHINAAAANIVDVISVNREVINTHIETTYLKWQEAVSLTRAKAILCIPRNRVLQLVKLGLLREVSSKPKTHFISGASLAEFLQEYICIERWANLNNLCCGKVLKNIGSKNEKPICHPFIFLKSKALAKNLANLNILDSHCQTQYHLF